MDWLGGLIAGALPIVGSLFSAKGQADANQQTASSTQAQMDFQERMSNTSWQRGVADMRAAGINPLYGAQGASTPGGAATVFQNTMSSFPSAFSSAVGAFNETRNVSSQVEQRSYGFPEAKARANVYKGAYGKGLAYVDETIKALPNLGRISLGSGVYSARSMFGPSLSFSPGALGGRSLN